MSRKVGVSKDSINGKVGAVKNALKKARACLPAEALQVLAEKIDPERHYQIEISRSAEKACKRLMLNHGKTVCPDGRPCDTCPAHGRRFAHEYGEVIFGDVVTGSNDSIYTYTTDGVKACIERNMVDPVFEPDKPYVMLLTYTYGDCDEEHNDTYHIVIYVPRDAEKCS